MKKLFLSFRLLSVFFLFVFLLFCQKGETQSQETYYVFQYYNVHPSKESEFLRLEFDVWKKMQLARLDSGLLDGWYFYRVISPTGTRSEHNFVVVLEYGGAEDLARHFEEFGVDYTQVLTAEEIRLALNTPYIRDLVYEEVWLSIDEMKNYTSDHFYRFQVFNTMRIKPGVTTQDYINLEQKYWKPIHNIRIKNNRMSGWGLYNLIIPGGTERDYQFATVDYFDRFIYIMDDNNPIMGQLHGARNIDRITKETLESRDLLKIEVRELLDFVTRK